MGEKESTLKAIVLLSGGIDSCVTATIAKNKYDEVFALSFLYGQKHQKEIESAKKISKWLKLNDHKIINIDPLLFTSSSLVGKNKEIPKRNLEEIGRGIPSTYVPARNIIFLSYALAYADSIGAGRILIGANAIDYSGYPDCRPEFIKAFQEVADVGTKSGVEGRKIKIETPFISMTKGEIIKRGIEIKAPLHLTWSCYEGREKACGKCDSCLLRLKGFKEAGYADPIEYEEYPPWYNREELTSFPFS